MVRHLDQDITVTNEMLDLLASLKMPETGLSYIDFYRWTNLQESLNQAVVDRFVTKTSNLKKLVIFDMKISGEAKESMAELTIEIIRNSRCLTQVDLDGNKYSSEWTAQLFSALSTCPSVTILDRVEFMYSADMS